MTFKTKHTCNDGNGPYFGRITPGCRRCDERAAGAPARPAPDWVTAMLNAYEDGNDELGDAIKAHYRKTGPHANGECGPVCTAFDL